MAPRTQQTQRGGPRPRKGETHGSAGATAPFWHSRNGRTALVFLWAVAVHLAFLVGSLERASPVSAFFFGDSLQYFAQGQALAEGRDLGAGLPFQPPLLPWLAALLWWALPSPAAVFLAGKGLMAVVNGATFAGVYRLLTRSPARSGAGPADGGGVPQAFLLCLLMPFAFGELLLSASLNGEAVYRLLLVLLLANGWRRPWLTGLLCGLASLTRAEHLPVTLLALALLAAVPFERIPRLSPQALERWFGVAVLPPQAERRRFALVAAAVLAAVLLPWVLHTHGVLSDYNERHGDRLAEPLPTVVPVSFYGPLNFALAQREAGIEFSRRTLPPAPGGAAELDPTFPPHQEVIVHGYRLGLEAIADDPGRAFRRTAAKLGFSLRALGQGWTWRDLPDGGPWLRPPVDLAYSPSGPWLAVSLALILLGAWVLRRHRLLLAVVAVLVLYRLAVNGVFFPYLRSMMVVSPAWWTLLLASWAVPLARWRAATTRAGVKAVAAVVLLLAVIHLSQAPTPRRYLLEGERDARGTIIDDRPVTLRYGGRQPR